MILCDHATTAEGKIFINGGAWDQIGPQPQPYSIAMIIKVPWDQTNQECTLHLALMTEDGIPVAVSNEPGAEPVPLRMEAVFEIGRPAGAKKGQEFTVPLAVGIAPQPLAPGRYRWELSLNGDHEEDWEVSFTFRQMPVLQS